MSTDAELSARITAARSRTPVRMRIGTTPIDINILLNQDDDHYLPQLHYARQYDAHGYPEMRKEFLDLLEASLDEKKTVAHQQKFQDLPEAVYALRVLETNFPETWVIYASVLLDGKTVLEAAEQHAVRITRAIRLLDHGRRVVDTAFTLAVYRKDRDRKHPTP